LKQHLFSIKKRQEKALLTISDRYMRSKNNVHD